MCVCCPNALRQMESIDVLVTIVCDYSAKKSITDNSSPASCLEMLLSHIVLGRINTSGRDCGAGLPE